MLKNASQLLKRRTRIGSIRLPVWAVVVVLLLAAAVAGQVSEIQGTGAVGPVLSGDIGGSAPLTVEQALVLSATSTDHHVTHLTYDEEGMVTVRTDRTRFTAAIELHVGSYVELHLEVNNLSDALAYGVMMLTIPGSIDVEVEEESGSTTLREVQLARDRWLLELASGNTSELEITIRPKADTTPGFYIIQGRIVQVDY